MWAVGGGTTKHIFRAAETTTFTVRRFRAMGLSNAGLHQSSPVPAVLSGKAWTSLHPDALYRKGKEMKTAICLASETE